MMQRDSIDFGNAPVGRLFRKMFVPTLLGMLSVAALTAIDGIFVGQGVGSNGLAGVNIVAPLFMVFTGLGLMLGVGSSVVAAIHLSEGNIKAARINITQALITATLLTLAICIPIMVDVRGFGLLMGGSETLMPWIYDYAVGIVPGMIFGLWCSIGLFVIRLDGSPNFAMWINVICSIINIVLDWLFIFPFGMGVFGAAVATSLSMGIGGALAISYICFRAKTLRFYHLKLTMKSIKLTLRNIAYQCRVGLSALLGELALAVFMLLGNYVFISYVGDDGVGAFSIACYYLPFIFMFGNAIAQSAQPIISYNNATSQQRAKLTQRYALLTALISGMAMTLLFEFGAKWLVTLYLPPSTPAARIAIDGIPWFATGFTIFVINLTAIGYYQSVERAVEATVYALLRGMVFIVPCFIVIPNMLGVKGIWLALPLSELLTMLTIVGFYFMSRSRAKR